MIVFPNCKINLGLRIRHKRVDGFHELSTIFFPVPWKDVLEIIPANHTQLAFTSSGLPVSGNPQNNLCVKAYHLLQQHFPQLTGVQMHLHKVIPMGAGLGGGSADASCTLQLLNQLFQLQASDALLHQLALQLGSDCPFFLNNQPCLATGRGELLTPVNLSLHNWTIVLINPGIHVNTAAAFAMLNRGNDPNDYPSPNLAKIIAQPVKEWRAQLINDFEAPVCSMHPRIGHLKESLYQAGATYAAMSGSGSTVFGLFEPHLTLSTSQFEEATVQIFRL